MFIDTIIWLYILIALAAVSLILTLKNLAEVKVWIKQRPKPGASLMQTSYLQMDGDGSAAEVRLPGSGSVPSIGRVIVDKQAGKENGYVEIITTDIGDETTTPAYKQTGYICFHEDSVIDKYGYIYRQEKGKRKKEIIGYCARPSAPDTPTIYGERTWHTLWLKCTLNAYLGKPATPAPSPENSNNGKKDEHTAAPAGLIGINAKKDKLQPMAEETMQPESTETAIQSQEVNMQPTEPATEPAAEEIKPIDNNTIEQPIEEITQPQEAAEQPKEEAAEQPKEETAEQPKEEETKPSQKEDSNKKSKKTKKSKPKEAAVSAYYYGFHSSSKDYLPAEARACAYAFLSGDIKRRKYSEYYKDQPYGWKDTALLTTAIYSILFILLYTVNTGIMQMPLLGDDFLAVGILIGCYYLLWSIVRMVKIDSIETSNSFQKRLDLFNKNLGLRGFNYTIILLSLLAIYFSLDFYDFDFIPLTWAILFGVAVNMSLKGANTSWTISTTFNEKNDEEENEDDIKNPPGDISRTYEWDLDKTYSTQQLHGSLTLYFTAQEMSDLRQCNPFFAQRKDKSVKEYILDMFTFLCEHKHFNARIRYITKYINDTINRNSLTPLDKIQFTLDFVQEPNIQFVKNRECKQINYYEDYIRYPEETLYDKEGDCNSKSLLAAMIFHTMGYNVLYLASRKHDHAAIGIEVSAEELGNGWYGENHENIIIKENGRTYIFCETTGDYFRIGKVLPGMTLNDFDDKVFIEFDNTENGESQDFKSNIFNWDLKSYYGNTLHGNLTIKFLESEINDMREMNPFCSYGHDSNTYEDNVRIMHTSISTTTEFNRDAKSVAEYIRSEIGKAGYPELDLIQFTLNFVQTPNIVYRIDEECASIDFVHEYMRYPAETLLDKEGDCDCKSFLAASIFNNLGYNVIFMLSKKLKHAAIAVECKEDWFPVIGTENIDNVVLEHNGRKYIYCESTGEGNMVGRINEGESIKDFETIVELPA